VLPEYAVDLYFAYSAGHDPTRVQYAAANMTGSNRLLIGIGWPLVTFVALAAYRRRRALGRPVDQSVTADTVQMEPSRRVEVGFLAAASAFAFVIVGTGALAWWNSIVLLGLFRSHRHARPSPPEDRRNTPLRSVGATGSRCGTALRQ